MASATVRHARREDASVILELIQALAAYEKEPRIDATVEAIRDTIAFAAPASAEDGITVPETEPISPNRPSRCLLLFDPEDKAIALALYFYNYSTWQAKPGIYLEDIFIQPSERGKGYGRRLMVELAKQAVAMQAGKMDWAVLKWNAPSIKFYERIGAKVMDEWAGMRIEGRAMEELARFYD
ncbi:uncharacterized protein UV8b_06057 [Ustilaginoidea virens]|uniref:N-acetyltransferase domain-containing protein n=1 Tax=Ustilaginoidea virens TaxID=1159556 RepID=A0A063BU50_USTVR|nr:uncharacterized protein UV8b_06057 [Ustilaginoidea virens]QUC21816.1 hypothetical protein UV8b_06057 [Ustilaginoidea virens]GAO17618.1 hypothetical protein UVI_02051010 [Ustilaginoidea virens]